MKIFDRIRRGALDYQHYWEPSKSKIIRRFIMFHILFWVFSDNHKGRLFLMLPSWTRVRWCLQRLKCRVGPDSGLILRLDLLDHSIFYQFPWSCLFNPISLCLNFMGWKTKATGLRTAVTRFILEFWGPYAQFSSIRGCANRRLSVVSHMQQIGSNSRYAHRRRSLALVNAKRAE